MFIGRILENECYIYLQKLPTLCAEQTKTELFFEAVTLRLVKWKIRICDNCNEYQDH